MELALNEEQRMIRDAALEVLAALSDSAAVRRAMENDGGFDGALWARLGAELGWCGIGLPEAEGGLGLGRLEQALLLEALGEHLACVPLFATAVLAGEALVQAADPAARREWLPALAAGEQRATLAWAGLQQPGAATGVEARRDGASLSLTGRVDYVLDGAGADWLLVPARIDGDLALCRVAADAPGVSRQALTTLDPTRTVASLALEAAPAECLGEGAGVAEGLARARDLARLALAAEQLGVAQRCLELSVAYTGERLQFGRPIAAFQAIKHRCAEMMVRVEEARSAVYGAAATITEEPAAAPREAAMAKSVADEAAFFCAQEAIQLHGGVGFTWEYDPHLYFKRAQANGAWLGRCDALLAELADTLLGPAEGEPPCR
ncbi:acyl-CoA dehydrogenase family protein [Halomonas sp. CS7]|uniref:Acyl-CoA dehydrogenase family protein n=1 Tax=Halomonas pelophila TaxID=3151122 RepID=A0ABV1N5T6_9GAMM